DHFFCHGHCAPVSEALDDIAFGAGYNKALADGPASLANNRSYSERPSKGNTYTAFGIHPVVQKKRIVARLVCSAGHSAEHRSKRAEAVECSQQRVDRRGKRI